MGKRNFIFTNRVHSKKGIMSIVLGVISCFTILFTIYFTYKSGESASVNYGAALFLAFIFSIVGFLLAVISRFEKDLFYFYSYVGMVLNFLVILGISILLYVGMKGI